MCKQSPSEILITYDGNRFAVEDHSKSAINEEK